MAFCVAVGDAVGVEVGQYLLLPGLEGAAEASDLRGGGRRRSW
jgi:hypothetical protein